MYKLFNLALIAAVKLFFELPFIKDHTKNNKIIKKTVDLYPISGFGGLSAKIRFWDSPLEKLEKYVPKRGTIVDLGCGEGILTNYLALCEPNRQLIGIELSEDRTKFASRGLKNTKFIQGDVLKKDFPVCDTIVMSHLMHHLPSYQSQAKLINQCYKNLKKNGDLIIAEVDKQLTLKYLFAWFTDTVIVPILFEKRLFNFQIFHRSSANWRRVLLDNNFMIDTIKPLKEGPFPDILIIAKKRG